MSESPAHPTAGEPPALPSRHRAVVAGLFFASGAAGLIYQVLWQRQLGGLFGNTAHSTAATLAVFFFGLSAGGWLFGRRAARFANPLAAYAAMEVGIGASALLAFLLLPLFDALYPSLFQLLHPRPALLLAFKALLATVVLAPPAILMGGTLPVMGQHVVKSAGQLGRRVSWLYGVNTAGAVAGVLAAGFLLPFHLGIRGSYAVAVGLNLAVAAGAWLLARAPAPTAAVRTREPADPEPAASRQLALRPSDLAVVAFGSGFCLLALEVLWTRMFAQVLQNSVYSFAIILATFLLALAVAAWLARDLCRSPARPELVLSLLLAGGGVLVALTPFAFIRLTGLTHVGADAGWLRYLAEISLYAAAVLLPPVLVAGCVFPFLFRLAESRADAPGRIVGRLAAVNTLGGILGSMVAGFLMLAHFGLWASIKAVGLCQILLAGWIGARSGARIRWRAAAIAAAGLLAVALGLDVGTLDDVGPSETPHEELIALWHGSDGTVAVIRDRDDLRLTINNNYNLGGSLYAPYEAMQAHIPLLLHPRPESVFLLGLGTGITAGATLDHPVEEVVATELVPEVVTASERFFGPFTNGLFRDPRARVVTDDGRSYLSGSGATYDVVIGDLFVPWRRGIGTLYTREHFAAVRRHLRPGGIFAQWLPLYQISGQEFAIVARTMTEVFPQVTLWRGGMSADLPILALVGHPRPAVLDPAVLVENLHRLGPGALLMGQVEPPLEATPFLLYAGNLSAAAELVAAAPLNTVDRPAIEYLAPKTERRSIAAQQTAWLTSLRLFDFCAELFRRVPPAEDPHLARLSPAQIGYVEAGLELYRAHALRADGQNSRGSFLLRKVAGQLAAAGADAEASPSLAELDAGAPRPRPDQAPEARVTAAGGPAASTIGAGSAGSR